MPSAISRKHCCFNTTAGWDDLSRGKRGLHLGGNENWLTVFWGDLNRSMNSVSACIADYDSSSENSFAALSSSSSTFSSPSEFLHCDSIAWNTSLCCLEVSSTSLLLELTRFGQLYVPSIKITYIHTRITLVLFNKQSGYVSICLRLKATFSIFETKSNFFHIWICRENRYPWGSNL